LGRVSDLKSLKNNVDITSVFAGAPYTRCVERLSRTEGEVIVFTPRRNQETGLS
jgi:hypothetical protein